jgi:Flp pilus assembly pilin Flp
MARLNSGCVVEEPRKRRGAALKARATPRDEKLMSEGQNIGDYELETEARRRLPDYWSNPMLCRTHSKTDSESRRYGRQRAVTRRAFGRGQRGATMVEYMTLVGFVAFAGIGAFYKYGTILRSNMRAQAALIEGKDLPDLDLMQWIMDDIIPNDCPWCEGNNGGLGLGDLGDLIGPGSGSGTTSGGTTSGGTSSGSTPSTGTDPGQTPHPVGSSSSGSTTSSGTSGGTPGSTTSSTPSYNQTTLPSDLDDPGSSDTSDDSGLYGPDK